MDETNFTPKNVGKFIRYVTKATSRLLRKDEFYKSKYMKVRRRRKSNVAKLETLTSFKKKVRNTERERILMQ